MLELQSYKKVGIRTIIFGLILFSSFPAYAGQRYNSKTHNTDYCITVRTEDGTVSNEKCLDLRISDGFLVDEGTYFLLRAGVNGTSGATSLTTSQLNISIGYSFVRKFIASDPAYRNGVLPNGQPGEMITIQITEIETTADHGPGTFTLTPVKGTGWTSAVFEAVGDSQTFLYIDDTSGWVPLPNTSVQSTF